MPHSVGSDEFKDLKKLLDAALVAQGSGQERASTRFLDAVINMFGLDENSLLQENARLNVEIQRLNQIDLLTGVLNRRQFYIMAQRELDRSRRYDSSLSLMLIDVDDFKLVNEKYGHAHGDTVLASVAASIRESLRSVDLICRLGGDEFVVMLPETHLLDTQLAAERLREHISGMSIPAGNHKVKVTTSIGISEMSDINHTIDRMIVEAGQALTRARQEGSNRVGI
jgi:two-component system cell cycle response regulator